MGKLFVLIICVVSLKTQAYSYLAMTELPHLDQEMSGREYQSILEKQVKSFDTASTAEDIEVEQWLTWGKRNLQWVDLVNSLRPEGQKISLSSPETQPGNSVSDPRVYNFKIIKEAWAKLKTSVPSALAQVIWGNQPLPSSIPISEAEFAKWLLEIDRAYQISARYKLRKPWQLFMSAEIRKDVRGFLNIKNDRAIDQKLSQWSKLSQAVKKQLTNDLTLICLNSGEFDFECADQITAAVKKNSLIAFKNRYLPEGQKNYDKFFIISSKRLDIIWPQGRPDLLTLPFKDPQNSSVLNFLRDNIQDEWRLGNWRLNLDFVASPPSGTASVRFVAGATPNVNGLAGSVITLDANAPLSEYDVQWTIRHEFGHVLGFPDCYHEFYDNNIQAFVSYQLDLNDVMCSRRGKLLPRHLTELQKAYYPTK